VLRNQLVFIWMWDLPKVNLTMWDLPWKKGHFSCFFQITFSINRQTNIYLKEAVPLFIWRLLVYFLLFWINGNPWAFLCQKFCEIYHFFPRTQFCFFYNKNSLYRFLLFLWLNALEIHYVPLPQKFTRIISLTKKFFFEAKFFRENGKNHGKSHIFQKTGYFRIISRFKGICVKLTFSTSSSIILLLFGQV